ncbi:MAG: N-acetylneuraminate synthase family protein [Bacteroidales bacterium]|nr:N-acetylneuraminate synthase family protein [Bacteroidales bacterium]
MDNLFQDLIIFEMANNHQGSLQHGINIIKELGKLKRKYKINAAVKFQYRNLDTFIHKDFKDRTDVKHIPRFQSTKLFDNEFKTLLNAVKQEDLITMATPFDEVSVDKCLDFGVDIIKVASCSAQDWPLLDKISQTNRPIILSTGGSTLHDIDALVSYFKHRECNFGLMHCVGMYPAENEDIHMNFLGKMIHRYPKLNIGWSGHEAPTNNEPAKIAVAKGAKMLERHIGLETDEIKLNAYSMNPAQTTEWLESVHKARTICGNSDNKDITEDEIQSLLSLKRGVYAKENIKKGENIIKDQVYFAMPCQESQLSSGEFGRYRAEYIAYKDYKANEKIIETPYSGDDVSIIREIIHTVKGMLHESKIIIPKNAELEISHHYGISKLKQFGAIIFSIVNREYCKKILICLPGQTNPMHMHKIKEETFQLLSGDLTINLKDKKIDLIPGELFLIEQNIMHDFTSVNGAIFEEISSTHRRGDSYYEDKYISDLDPMQRKTIIKDWQ